MSRPGVVPGEVTYCTLFSAWEKGKGPERALTLFESMQAQGLMPNLVTFPGLISACEKGQARQSNQRQSPTAA